MADYNVITAIENFAISPDFGLIERDGVVVNKANAIGESLEDFVKKFLAHRLSSKETLKDLEHFQNVFSYLGNANNPPDMILRNGDAIEVKKVQSKSARLALNSSFPKNKLFASDSRILDSCRNCEDWTEKDIFYVVGNVLKGSNHVKHLWLVHGSCYAANKGSYERIAKTITHGVQSIDGLEVDTETNELSGVKKVDPLGITNLRVRGMWGIDHPSKVFSYIYQQPTNTRFSLSCIITEDKFNALLPAGFTFKNTTVSDVKIKNPNAPVDLLDAKLLTFSIK